MSLHSLALRASKNAILARYFGRSMDAPEWETVFKSWSEEEVTTFGLILNEIEGMELDVEEKALRRHEVNQARLRQRVEAVTIEVERKTNSKM